MRAGTGCRIPGVPDHAPAKPTDRRGTFDQSQTSELDVIVFRRQTNRPEVNSTPTKNAILTEATRAMFPMLRSGFAVDDGSKATKVKTARSRW